LSFEIFWTPTALEHLEFWHKNSPKKIQKIKVLARSYFSSGEAIQNSDEKWIASFGLHTHSC
jgi:hypothetical protein